MELKILSDEEAQEVWNEEVDNPDHDHFTCIAAVNKAQAKLTIEQILDLFEANPHGAEDWKIIEELRKMVCPSDCPYTCKCADDPQKADYCPLNTISPPFKRGEA